MTGTICHPEVRDEKWLVQFSSDVVQTVVRKPVSQLVSCSSLIPSHQFAELPQSTIGE